jgi:hypothetical protein
MAQRLSRLLGSPETRSLIFSLKIRLIRRKVTWITYNPGLIWFVVPGVWSWGLSQRRSDWSYAPSTWFEKDAETERVICCKRERSHFVAQVFVDVVPKSMDILGFHRTVRNSQVTGYDLVVGPKNEGSIKPREILRPTWKRGCGSGTWSWRASASKTRRGVVVTVHFQGKDLWGECETHNCVVVTDFFHRLFLRYFLNRVFIVKLPLLKKVQKLKTCVSCVVFCVCDGEMKDERFSLWFRMRLGSFCEILWLKIVCRVQIFLCNWAGNTGIVATGFGAEMSKWQKKC